MNKELKIISCEQCKNFCINKVNKTNLIYSCKLNKNCFEINKPEVNCNKPCFKKK